MMLRQIAFGLAAACVSLVAADGIDPNAPKLQLFKTEPSYVMGTTITIQFTDPDAFGATTLIKLFQAGLPSDNPPGLPLNTGNFGGGSIAPITICPNVTNGLATCPTPPLGQTGNFSVTLPAQLLTYTAAEGGPAPKNYFLGITWFENNADNFYYSKTFYLTADAPSSSAVAPVVSSPTATATVSSSSVAAASSSSEGLSTGAKAGIGAGIGAAALITIIGLGVFFLRRRKNRPEGGAGMEYAQAQDTDSRDLRGEKDMNVVAAGRQYSPERTESFNEMQPTAQREWPEAEGSAFKGAPPAGAYAGSTVAHLKKPGMSHAEVASLDEEERRIDEAIADAERRRR